jgi:DNA primase
MSTHQPPLDVRVAAARQLAANARTSTEAVRAGAQAPTGTLDATRTRIYAEAERFYQQRHRGSWVPNYLQNRGLPLELQERWCTGYAPNQWTALTTYLRGQSFSDAEIEASGLAFRARRGGRNLVDLFRNRAVWPIRTIDGATVAFVGRAAPGSKEERSAKYLNSPDGTDYHKGHVLFGLAESRERLAAGARPVVVEGPLDVLAVNAAGGAYAAVGTCGVAFTPHHAAALARAVDPGSTGRFANTGIVFAMDGDDAGRRGMIAAFHAAAPFTDHVHAVIFPPGRDPAELLRTVGPHALGQGLQVHARPLADLVMDSHLDALVERYQQLRAFNQDGAWIDAFEGRLMLAYEAAALIVQLPPAHTARQVARTTRRLNLEHRLVTQALLASLDAVQQAPKRLARRGDDRQANRQRATTAVGAAAGFPTTTGQRMRAPRPDSPAPGAPTLSAPRALPQER